MSKLKENIQELMKARNWGGQDLARNSNQKVSDIYNILHGRSKKPSDEKIAAIARTFGVSVSDVVYGKVHKPALEQPGEEWDGILYTDSMNAVREAFIKLGKKFQEAEDERNALLQLTMRVYNFARKHNSLKPDPIFAEEIIKVAYSLQP